eukprot:1620417-Rhodomonas_salina.1
MQSHCRQRYSYEDWVHGLRKAKARASRLRKAWAQRVRRLGFIVKPGTDNTYVFCGDKSKEAEQDADTESHSGVTLTDTYTSTDTRETVSDPSRRAEEDVLAEIAGLTDKPQSGQTLTDTYTSADTLAEEDVLEDAGFTDTEPQSEEVLEDAGFTDTEPQSEATLTDTYTSADTRETVPDPSTGTEEHSISSAHVLDDPLDIQVKHSVFQQPAGASNQHQLVSGVNQALRAVSAKPDAWSLATIA